MKKGDKFDTPFEKGCVVVTTPDEYGDFIAIDSDGVECVFNVKMIINANDNARREEFGNWI